MKLYLIRHGRQCSKLCNVNVELSEEGLRQAALLGERLADTQIDALYSSNLIRAVQTAQAANLYWNVEHVICPELREISFGEMEGMSDDMIALKYKDFKIEQDTMLVDCPYPGGECAADVVTRVIPLLKTITESGSKHVAIVTHGGVIRSLTAHLIGLNLARYRLLGGNLENCSITEIEYDPEKDRYFLQRLNDFAHLQRYPELLRKSWVDVEN